MKLEYNDRNKLVKRTDPGVLFTGHKYRDMNYIQERFGLTNREIETAAHIVNGLSNRDIAEKMKITDNTVKTHITNLYQKLHVTGKAELIKCLRDVDPNLRHWLHPRIFNKIIISHRFG